ncbi:MAG TPA: alpha/beta fold hydrolase [Bacillales bacterium]|nr:alpha/beta fold hydrolase [Bacillales bacterium]
MQKAAELVHKGKTLRGMVHRPDANETSFPAVVLFHGFTGSKGEDKFLFVRIARALCEEGIGCVRFDFSGSGESDGRFADMTFSGEMSEAQAILNFTRQLEWTDNERIGVLGFSMGAAVAAQITKDRAADVAKLCLLSPAGNMPDKAKLYFETCTFLPNGHADLGGLELGRAFVEDLADRDLYDGVERYENPVLILHGAKDEAVPEHVGRNYADLYKNAAFVAVDEADHSFSSAVWRNELVQRVSAFFGGRQP